MAHTRMRKFNTRDTYPEQRLDNDLCMAVRAGNQIFLRGQIGHDLEGSVPSASATPRKQAEQAMRNVQDAARGSRLPGSSTSARSRSTSPTAPTASRSIG